MKLVAAQYTLYLKDLSIGRVFIMVDSSSRERTVDCRGQVIETSPVLSLLNAVGLYPWVALNENHTDQR